MAPEHEPPSSEAAEIPRHEPGRGSFGLERAPLTPARIGLERIGVSLATVEALRFAEAHALARDAVHARLAVAPLLAQLRERGLEALSVTSAARSRQEYLLRPDLGRRLSESSEASLAARAAHPADSAAARLSVVIADGLSALAVERHAFSVVVELLGRLGLGETGNTAGAGWLVTPVVVAEQGRVALGDAVARALGAQAAVVLIGERPGLSSADSLGAYVTWAPGPGTTDAERNCVSNIRREGLCYADAAAAIDWYLTEGRRHGRTGVGIRGPERQARLAPMGGAKLE